LMTAGIVEMNREKKIAYDVVRAMYLGEKSAALPVGTASPSSPVSYVLVGLLLLILFAWLINSNRRFRESVTRALFRPYNFFADVRDQRLLSPVHSTLLVVIVSVTFAIIFSSLVYHFRMNPAFDYVLTHLLISDSAKYVAIQLTWNAPFCIVAVSVFMFIWFYVVTLLIQGISFFIKARVTLYHSYAVSVWSTLPWIVFIPLGMIVYRVMENAAYVTPVLLLCAAIFLWIFFRIIKGMSVIYDVLPLKAYAVAFVVVAVILGGAFLAYDHFFSTAAYIDYFITMVLPSMR
jgi:beta-galactosidase